MSDVCYCSKPLPILTATLPSERGKGEAAEKTSGAAQFSLGIELGHRNPEAGLRAEIEPGESPGWGDAALIRSGL